MNNSENPAIRLNLTSLLLLVVLPLVSGAAALSHELLWTRRLVDLLGATDWVTGRVLGFFFLGLSLGGYLATFHSRSKAPAIRWLFSAEICIAVLSLPAAFLPLWTDWIWQSMGTDALISWQGSAVKLLIAIGVVIPPSMAMGFTLPMFIRTATDKGARVASVGIWIYMLNTIGGVFGLWLTSTFLIGWLGAQGTMFAAAAANVFVALTLIGLTAIGGSTETSGQSNISRQKKRQEKRKSQSSVESVENEGNTFSTRGLIGLSFLSGFVVLSFEVLLLRLISLVVPGSYHTTSALLANVILFLAISSGLVSLSNSVKPTRNLAAGRWFLIISFAGTALFACLSPMLLFECTDQLMSIRYLEGLNDRAIDTVGRYWILVFWLVATSGGLVLLVSGLVFPALMTASAVADPKGKKIGILLAVNGVGGLVGTELFNSLIIGTTGVYQGFVLLAAILAVVVAGLSFRLNRVLAALLTFAIAAAVFFAHDYYRDLPYLSPRASANFDVKATHFSREGVWLIVENQDNNSLSIIGNNQYILGSNGASAAANQRRQLMLPWILNPEAQSVCSLGLATGISSSGLENLDEPPPVTAVELSANVEALAKEYFADSTGGFFERAGNSVVIEDARTYMAAADNQFDLIVGDLYRPYGTGEGRLFSIEHFRNVQRALTEDGLFCQWLPLHQLNYENWLTIAASFQQVFPDTLVVYDNTSTRFPILGLIAKKNGGQWTEQELNDRFDAIPAGVLSDDPLLNIVRELVVGVLNEEALTEVPVNTLDNLRVEISAGDFWILKDLRPRRSISFESEFLMGDQLIEFNDRLEALTVDVLPANHFESFREKIRFQLNRASAPR
ncbi:MAG: hypothetical protein AAF456_11000 [Planctomycetota bacterium]